MWSGQGMLLQIAYLVMLIAVCGYAAIKGGASEKAGAAIMFVGSFATVPAGMLIDPIWASAQSGILAVDVVVLAAFLWLAFKTDKFWPLWATGFHIVTVTTHLARIVQPSIVPIAYATAAELWAYPMLMVISIGVQMNGKARSQA
jgi:hypothetical protein